jgi:hypothetical protein
MQAHLALRWRFLRAVLVEMTDAAGVGLPATDVRPAGLRLVSSRCIRAQWEAVGAEPFGEVGNRMKGQTV